MIHPLGILAFVALCLGIREIDRVFRPRVRA